MKKGILLLLLTVIFLLCGQKDLASFYKENAKAKLELNELSITNDTLTIVSSMDFLYHPFGYHSSLSSFDKKYAILYDSCTIIPKEKPYELYKLSGSGFNLVFFLVSKKPTPLALEIVSAYIDNSNVALINGIHIGMFKSDLLKMFFQKQYILISSIAFALNQA